MSKFSDLLRNDEASARYLLESGSYREFLKRFFELKKKTNPSYSYNVFARSAVMAKSLPRDIIEGERRLTEKSLPKFLKAMQLPSLIEEFFTKLVENETNPIDKSYLNKLSQIFIESHFKKGFTDQNFQDTAIPFIYAASGNVGEGASLEVISERTGLSISKIIQVIDKLETLGLGKYDHAKKVFSPTISQVHVDSGEDKSNFRNFYLYCLGLQKEAFIASQNKGLFYNNVFSINQNDFPHLKEEMQKTLKSFVLKSESAVGSCVAVLNHGLFIQNFED